MASYYACYLIVILLTLGVYLRLKNKKQCSKIICAVTLLLNFSLGINSPREMLVLNIPLLIMEAISTIAAISKTKQCKSVFEKNKALYFSVAAFAVNLCGMVLIKLLNVKSHPIIEPVNLETNLGNIIINLKSTVNSFLTISGLNFIKNGLKWYPLFAFAVLLACGVCAAIVIIIKKKDRGWLAKVIIFSAISILCVGGVGVFLMSVRPLYFFVWYVLSAFSWMYLSVNVKHKLFNVVLLAICAFSVVNYACNFYPDFSQYRSRNDFYKNVEQYLEEQNIKFVYVDAHTSPTSVVYSDDEIVSGSVNFNFAAEKNGELMTPFAYLQPTDIWEQNSGDSCVMLSNWTFDYFEREAPKEYVDKLMSALTLEKEFDLDGTQKLYVYRFSEPVIDYQNK